jgi:hypothetical protein
MNKNIQNHNESVDFRGIAKRHTIKIVVMLLSLFAGLGFFARDPLILIFCIPLIIVLYKHRPQTEEEKQERADAANQSFAIGLLIPIIFLICISLYVIAKMVIGIVAK